MINKADMCLESNDGRYLLKVVGSRAYVCDLNSNETIYAKIDMGLSIYSACFSTDSNRLALKCPSGKINVYDTTQKESIFLTKEARRGKKGENTILMNCLSFLSNDKLLFVVSVNAKDSLSWIDMISGKESIVYEAGMLIESIKVDQEGKSCLICACDTIQDDITPMKIVRINLSDNTSDTILIRQRENKELACYAVFIDEAQNHLLVSTERYIELYENHEGRFLITQRVSSCFNDAWHTHSGILPLPNEPFALLIDGMKGFRLFSYEKMKVVKRYDQPVFMCDMHTFDHDKKSLYLILDMEKLDNGKISGLRARRIDIEHFLSGMYDADLRLAEMYGAL